MRGRPPPPLVCVLPRSVKKRSSGGGGATPADRAPPAPTDRVTRSAGRRASSAGGGGGKENAGRAGVAGMALDCAPPLTAPSHPQQQQQCQGQGLPLVNLHPRSSGGGSGGAPGPSTGCVGAARRGSLDPGTALAGGPSSVGGAGGGTGPYSVFRVGGQSCRIVDGALEASPSDCLILSVRSFTGIQRSFYVCRTAKLGRMFELYCSRMGISLGAVQ